MKQWIRAAALAITLCCALMAAASAYTGVPSYFTQEIQEADNNGIIPNILEDADLSRNITRREFCHVIVAAYDHYLNSGSGWGGYDPWYGWGDTYYYFSSPKTAAKVTAKSLPDIWYEDDDLVDYYYDEYGNLWFVEWDGTEWMYFEDDWSSGWEWDWPECWNMLSDGSFWGYDSYGNLWYWDADESEPCIIDEDDAWWLDDADDWNDGWNDHRNDVPDNDRNEPRPSSYFSDVTDSVIDRAYELGFVGGYEDGTFRPDNQITRQEMFKMMYSLLDKTRWVYGMSTFKASAFLNNYPDGWAVADWAKPSTATLLYYGVVNGSNGYVDPGSQSSCAQAIVLANRVLTNDLTESTLPVKYPIISDMGFYFNSSGLAIDYSNSSFSWDDYTSHEDYIFDGGPRYATAAQTTPHIVSVKVPVWKLKSDGTKYSSTATIQVHEKLQHIVWAIFNEIYNDPEQFPIADLGGYSWRGDTSNSEHKWGLAIDINANANPQVWDGVVRVGTAWNPGVDPYSITPDGSVVRIFQKYGFTWGGDAWGEGTRDYMHFSYLGT